MEPDSRIGRMSNWSALRAAHRRPLRVALLPCAGRGERAGVGRPKQYVEVAGRSVVHWTLLAFDELVGQGHLDAVAVVLSPGDREFDQAVPSALLKRLQVMPVGGATRAHSVLGGLQSLAGEGLAETDWVLVHDAARCLIEPAELLRLIQACESDAVGGLLACPVPDTLKRADALGRAQATVSREHLWAAQTPQMFRLGLLLDVLGRALQAGVPVTDEAGAVEWSGLAPKLVAGPADNFKLTYPDDFRRAADLLARRSTSIGTT